MDIIRRALDIKASIIIVLSVTCVFELCFVFKGCEDDGGVDFHVKLNDSRCFFSENIGRHIFLHVCEKDNGRVYDSRYFWHLEDEYLKPGKIGVQLTETEFERVCSLC